MLYSIVGFVVILVASYFHFDNELSSVETVEPLKRANKVVRPFDTVVDAQESAVIHVTAPMHLTGKEEWSKLIKHENQL